MAISEITPSAVKIDKLISRVAEGDIKIPASQRHFVWDEEQVIELLDSIYHDYPIGSILLWSSHDKLKATCNICGFSIPDRAESYPVNYVLDGQQRLSTSCRSREAHKTTLKRRPTSATFEIRSLIWCPRAQFPSNEGHNTRNISPQLNYLFEITAFDQRPKGAAGGIPPYRARSATKFKRIMNCTNSSDYKAFQGRS